MSNSAYRWLRAAAAVPAAALVALAVAVPASAQSSDNQPPSAPRNVTSTYFTDRHLTTIDWDASTDDTDAPEDLIYIVETSDPYAPRLVIRGGATQASALTPYPVTVWAVDTSGNESEKVIVQTTVV